MVSINLRAFIDNSNDPIDNNDDESKYILMYGNLPTS